jgi:hypothetical protein
LIEATIADRENIRVGNEALADMKSLGATLVDPVDFSGAIAKVMTAYEPNFFTRTFPTAIPVGAKPIDHLVAIAGDRWARLSASFDNEVSARRSESRSPGAMVKPQACSSINRESSPSLAPIAMIGRPAALRRIRTQLDLIPLR